MRLLDDDDPGLPIKLGPCSNGEYEPEPLSPVLEEAVRRARAASEESARRLGMSRRDFLLSICGAATTLLALEACTSESARGPRGGSFDVTPEATVDPGAAREAIGGEELVFDVQGHLLDYGVHAGEPQDHEFWSRFPQQHCGEDDPRVCYSIDHFLEEMFLKSDTSMAVISALPIAPENSPLSHEVMDLTRRVALALCNDERLFLHGQTLPNVGPLEANLEAMEETVARYPVVAWKVFTHYPDLWEGGDDAWWLDDHEPGVPAVGERFIAKSLELGVRIVCVHKGFSGGSRFASPEDVGPAARKHPEMSFIVYHSGFEARVPEVPYMKATRGVGINRLISSMKRAGIGPNENVYAELGSTWWYAMRDPTQAAHVLGKLLRYVGEENVLWGTDCLFYGSPQDQIQALRAFRISDEFQERYGYPKLTPEIKQKILGRNAARVYGVDPVTAKCEFTRRELEDVRMGLRSGNRTYGPTTMAQYRTLAEHHRLSP